MIFPRVRIKGFLGSSISQSKSAASGLKSIRSRPFRSGRRAIKEKSVASLERERLSQPKRRSDQFLPESVGEEREIVGLEQPAFSPGSKGHFSEIGHSSGPFRPELCHSLFDR